MNQTMAFAALIPFLDVIGSARQLHDIRIGVEEM